jgi:RHS repeat-associated protein
VTIDYTYDGLYRLTKAEYSTGELFEFSYDANGNMTERTESGVSYEQDFDAENHLIFVTTNGQTTQFIYDGDGIMVKGVVNSTTTFYPGRHYNKEVTSTATKVQKFYFVLGQTIAVRTLQNETDTLQWILSDHLSSASVTANVDGSWNSTIQYTAFGEIRLARGITPTKYRYTGQLAQDVLGLDYYVARWYDPLIGHFTSSDTIIMDPFIVLSWNRYSYGLFNPIRYFDPTGHSVDCGLGDPYCSAGKYTPGGLYHLYEVSKEIIQDNQDTKTWNKEVNNYLKKDPDYKPVNDRYFTSHQANVVFRDLRLDYWGNRLSETGLCNGILECQVEANDYMSYYDNHEMVYRERVNPSLLDVKSILLDVAGIPLALVGLGGVKPFLQEFLLIWDMQIVQHLLLFLRMEAILEE